MDKTVWFTRCPVPTATGMAIRQGLIDERLRSTGWQARSLAASTDPKVRQAHFDQSQDHLFRHGGNTPPIMALARGGDLRIVGMSWYDAYRAILVLPGSGIRTAADLKGRRLSLPRRNKDAVDFWRSTALRGAGQVLAGEGLSLGDVQLVPVDTDRTFVEDSRQGTSANDTLWDADFMLGHQREEAFALIRGEVDAVFTQGAQGALLRGFLGAHSVQGRPAGRLHNNDTPLLFTMSGRLIDEAPEAAAAILRAALDASAWAARHASDAHRLLAADVGLPEEMAARAYSPAIHEQLAIDLADDKVALLQAQIAGLHSLEMIPAPFDARQSIDPRPLQAALAL